MYRVISSNLKDGNQNYASFSAHNVIYGNKLTLFMKMEHFLKSELMCL